MSKFSLPDIALTDNTSQRLPCILLMDDRGIEHPLFVMGRGSTFAGGRSSSLRQGHLMKHKKMWFAAWFINFLMASTLAWAEEPCGESMQ